MNQNSLVKVALSALLFAVGKTLEFGNLNLATDVSQKFSKEVDCTANNSEFANTKAELNNPAKISAFELRRQAA